MIGNKLASLYQLIKQHNALTSLHELTKQNTIKTEAFLFRDSKNVSINILFQKFCLGCKTVPSKMSWMEKTAKLINGGDIY